MGNYIEFVNKNLTAITSLLNFKNFYDLLKSRIIDIESGGFVRILVYGHVLSYYSFFAIANSYRLLDISENKDQIFILFQIQKYEPVATKMCYLLLHLFNGIFTGKKPGIGDIVDVDFSFYFPLIDYFVTEEKKFKIMYKYVAEERRHCKFLNIDEFISLLALEDKVDK